MSLIKPKPKGKQTGHPIVQAITQMPREERNQHQNRLLFLMQRSKPKIPQIKNLLNNPSTFDGLHLMGSIDIDVNDWIRKIRGGVSNNIIG
jgi:hypothetical protein